MVCYYMHYWEFYDCIYTSRPSNSFREETLINKVILQIPKNNRMLLKSNINISNLLHCWRTTLPWIQPSILSPFSTQPEANKTGWILRNGGIIIQLCSLVGIIKCSITYRNAPLLIGILNRLCTCIDNP